jgi:hypothetical protein
LVVNVNGCGELSTPCFAVDPTTIYHIIELSMMAISRHVHFKNGEGLAAGVGAV